MDIHHCYLPSPPLYLTNLNPAPPTASPCRVRMHEVTQWRNISTVGLHKKLHKIHVTKIPVTTEREWSVINVTTQKKFPTIQSVHNYHNSFFLKNANLPPTIILETFPTTMTRFSQCYIERCMWASVILAGKRDSRRHSTAGWGKNVKVEETSYQLLEVLW